MLSVCILVFRFSTVLWHIVVNASKKKKACIVSINVAGFPFGDRSVSELIDFLTHFLGRGVKEFHSYVSKNLDPLLMFYGSTVEHRQGSRISESHKARHGIPQIFLTAEGFLGNTVMYYNYSGDSSSVAS